MNPFLNLYDFRILAIVGSKNDRFALIEIKIDKYCRLTAMHFGLINIEIHYSTKEAFIRPHRFWDKRLWDIAPECEKLIRLIIRPHEHLFSYIAEDDIGKIFPFCGNPNTITTLAKLL